MSIFRATAPSPSPDRPRAQTRTPAPHRHRPRLRILKAGGKGTIVGGDGEIYRTALLAAGPADPVVGINLRQMRGPLFDAMAIQGIGEPPYAPGRRCKYTSSTHVAC